VELGEIESVLCQHPGVADAAVVADSAPDGELGLTAYIVRAAGSTVGESLLREHLRGRLPEYMRGGRYCLLPPLPLTAHGQVGRRGLPAPDGDRPDLSTPYVPPRTQVEELLAEVFADITGVARVGIHDDFFALGGNSLSATRVVAQLRRLLGVGMPLWVVF